MLDPLVFSGRFLALVALLGSGCLPVSLDPILTDVSPGTGLAGDGSATSPTTGDASSATASTTDMATTMTGPQPSSETAAEPAIDTTAGPGSTTGEGTSTGEPPGCEPACEGPTPYCLDETCVSCTEVGCAVVDPEKPLCLEALGVCVQCLEDSDCLAAETPLCNEERGACECTSHDQCPAGACNLESGQCFPAGGLFVDNTPDGVNPCSDSKPSPWGTSPEQPLCTLQTAMMRLVGGAATVVKVKTGSKPQALPATVPEGDFTVAIVPYGATVPSLQPLATDPALTISAGNTVFMARIGVLDEVSVSEPMIACEGGAPGARLWLDEQRVTGGRTALSARNCHVHVHRSFITEHTRGGIEIGGDDGDLARLWIENSFITGNAGSKFSAVRLASAASADVLYSTLALNSETLPSIDCVDNWTGTLTVRNAVIVGPDPRFGAGCDAASAVTSWEASGTDPAQLEAAFSDFGNGQLGARLDGSLKDVAVWKAGDPTVDIDGDLRPTIDGSGDYAGADRAGR